MKYKARGPISDPTQVRVAIIDADEISHAPLDGVGLQILDSTLTGLSTLDGTPGIVTQTATDTFTKRALTGTANQVDVANGSGAAGNPTLTLSSTMVAPGSLSVTGAFTSIGIDDNATAERVQIADTVLNLGPATSAGYTIGSASNAGALDINGGTSSSSGGRIVLLGESHATLADQVFVDAAIVTFRDAAGGSGGLVTLQGGQLLFPATAIPSANANCLDDYKEGTWTPTITAGSGTFTSVSATGSYTKIGNRVLCEMTITITTNGSAAGNVQATLPFAPASASVGCGRCAAVSGSMVQGVVSGSGVAIFTYNNAYPGASGETINFSIQYKV